MQPNSSIFEPVQAIVVPSGYVHSQPLEAVPSSNQGAYGNFSNNRGLNSQAMNKPPEIVSQLPRTRQQRVSTLQTYGRFE